MPANTRRILGALARRQHEAATGQCAIGTCTEPSVGYIQGSSNRPAGVCATHKTGAEERGYTVHTDPIAQGGNS